MIYILLRQSVSGILFISACIPTFASFGASKVIAQAEKKTSRSAPLYDCVPEISIRVDVSDGHLSDEIVVKARIENHCERVLPLSDSQIFFSLIPEASIYNGSDPIRKRFIGHFSLIESAKNTSPKTKLVFLDQNESFIFQLTLKSVSWFETNNSGSFQDAPPSNTIFPGVYFLTLAIRPFSLDVTSMSQINGKRAMQLAESNKIRLKL